MQRYKVTGPRPALDHEPGEEFDHEFTVDEEDALVSAGRLEIVPRRYRVLGTSKILGHKPGAAFTHAFSLAQEQALVFGGHIEAEPEKRKKPAPEAAGRSQAKSPARGKE